jgi:lipopolysaccharide transport system permease protein
MDELTRLSVHDDAPAPPSPGARHAVAAVDEPSRPPRAEQRWIENAPSHAWLPRIDLAELWASRELVLTLALRNIKVRYKQTALGVVWAILQPLIGVVIFTIVMRRLAHIPSEGIPYAVFAFAGLIPWTYFVNSANQAADSLVAYRELVTKVYFPRLLAPISAVLPGLIDLGISLLALGVLMAVLGVKPGAQIVLLPLWVVALVVITGGIGIGLSAVNARYRDVRNALGFLLQIGLFATPVVYPSTLAHGALRTLLYVNPLAGVIECFRWSVIGTPLPTAAAFVSLASGLLVFFAGLLYFARVERRLADVI